MRVSKQQFFGHGFNEINLRMIRNALTLRVVNLARKGVATRSLASQVGPYGPNMPDATMDDIPVPCQPYEQVYNQLNGKWNLWLGASAALFAATVVGIATTDSFHGSYGSAPASYQNRTQPPYAGEPRA